MEQRASRGNIPSMLQLVLCLRTPLLKGVICWSCWRRETVWSWWRTCRSLWATEKYLFSASPHSSTNGCCFFSVHSRNASSGPSCYPFSVGFWNRLSCRTSRPSSTHSVRLSIGKPRTASCSESVAYYESTNDRHDHHLTLYRPWENRPTIPLPGYCNQEIRHPSYWCSSPAPWFFRPWIISFV